MRIDFDKLYVVVGAYPVEGVYTTKEEADIECAMHQKPINKVWKGISDESRPHSVVMTLEDYISTKCDEREQFVREE